MNLKTFKEFLLEGQWGKVVGKYKDFSIRISDHTQQPRKNSSKPRHNNLTNEQLVKIISMGYDLINPETPFILTFPIDDYFGALIGIKIKNTIRIITMIVHESNKDHRKIQKKRTNRYHITTNI